MSFLQRFLRTTTTRNRLSKTAIKDDRIIIQNDKGVVESLNNGWRFTPAAEIEKITTNVVGPYDTPALPQPPPLHPVEEFNSPQPTSFLNTQDIISATYFFGIDEITSHYNLIHQVCGVVFKDINIGRCSYIELAVDVLTNDNCSVEFYIVDGTKEIPILPVSCDRVVNEKLFFNMNPRFDIDTKKNIEIKNNGAIIKRNIEGLEELDLQNGIYTINYTPINAYKCFPENETINIKVIQRLYSDTAEPSCITNMLIRKYGGGVPWTE